MHARIVGVALAAWMAAGCFTYAPSGPERVSPGDDVRITVDADGAARLRGLLGEDFAPAPQRRVDGTVLSRDGDRLFVSVPRAVRRSGRQNDVLRQQLDIAEDEVARLEVRQVDWMRTGPAVALGAAAVAVVMARTFTDLVGGPGGVDNPPRRPQLRPLPQ